jgi:3-oxoacyl-[acyl-carrier-protein] synthase-3
MNEIRSYISGVGGYLPSKIVTNDDLSKFLDTSDEWIYSRTGMSQRHIAHENETTSDMSAQAAKIAIQNAKIQPKDIDLIIVATTTPDKTFPSVAAITQAKLGIKDCAAFDIQAVCSGFIYALSVADGLIKTGNYNNALVIGADKMSSLLDWADRSTCVLFGDGAGAVILSKSSSKKSGIVDSTIHADGSLEEILYTSGGVATNQKTGVVKMNGKEVYRHAIEKMSSSIIGIMKKHNIKNEDIDFVVPHQANIRIIQSIATKLGIAENKTIITVKNHSNTSAATIPLALFENYHKFKRGNYIILTAAGGGFTWGSVLMRW